MEFIYAKIGRILLSTMINRILYYPVRIFKKIFGGVMIKLLIVGAIFGMISNVTGIPLSPVYPTISRQNLKFEATSIDDEKYETFKKYVGSKF